MSRLVFSISAWAMLAGACCAQSVSSGIWNNTCGDVWYLQAETLFIGPTSDVRDSDPTFTFNNVAPATAFAPTTGVPDSGGLTASPRITLGRIIANGWGVQTRFWDLQFRDGFGSAGPFSDLTTQPGFDRRGAYDSLHAYTWDIEAAKCLSLFDAPILGTFGARHGSIDQSTNQTAFGQATGGDSFTLTATDGLQFDGTGVTYSLFGLRPIDCTNWSWYLGGRMSHLFGTAKGYAATSASVTSGGATGTSTNGAIAHEDADLTVGEMQAGLQWARCIRNCRAQWFFRSGLEYQYWHMSGGNLVAAATSNAASANGNAVVATSSQNTGFDTHLIGLGLTAGISW